MGLVVRVLMRLGARDVPEIGVEVEA